MTYSATTLMMLGTQYLVIFKVKILKFGTVVIASMGIYLVALSMFKASRSHRDKFVGAIKSDFHHKKKALGCPSINSIVRTSLGILMTDWCNKKTVLACKEIGCSLKKFQIDFYISETVFGDKKRDCFWGITLKTLEADLYTFEVDLMDCLEEAVDEHGQQLGNTWDHTPLPKGDGDLFLLTCLSSFCRYYSCNTFRDSLFDHYTHLLAKQWQEGFRLLHDMMATLVIFLILLPVIDIMDNWEKAAPPWRDEFVIKVAQ